MRSEPRIVTAASERGFSLLEVMVAIAILGLSLTVILAAQGGLASTNKSAANMGLAVSFGRCKMSELEEKLLKLGYPAVEDLQTDVPCCGDYSTAPFTCDTKVQTVMLPAPPGSAAGDGGLSLGGSLAALEGGVPTMPGSPGGIPSALINPGGGAGLSLDVDAGIGGLATMGTQLQGQMGGMNGMLNMVLGFVYPSLKSAFETSIRKLTVTLHWTEGIHTRELTLTQYVTNPQMAGFMSGALGADGGAPLTTGTSAPGVAGAAGASPLGGATPFGNGTPSAAGARPN